MHDLIHVNEALAGLPIDVDFISFKDVEEKSLEEYSVIINAGRAGDAWSGGDGWNSEVTAKLTRWVHEGGIFLGINEPSARRGQMHFFQMAEALGVDLDMGEYVCHGRWTYEVKKGNNLVTEGCVWKEGKNIFLTDPATRVFAEKDGLPVCTVHDFGKGKGVYLASFAYNPAYTQLLMNILLLAGEKAQVLSENPMTECAWFVNHKKIVVVNNTDKEQETRIECEGTYRLIHLKPYEMQVIDQ